MNGLFIYPNHLCGYLKDERLFKVHKKTIKIFYKYKTIKKVSTAT